MTLKSCLWSCLFFKRKLKSHIGFIFEERITYLLCVTNIQFGLHKQIRAFCIRIPNYAMRSHTVNLCDVLGDPEWIP